VLSSGRRVPVIVLTVEAYVRGMLMSLSYINYVVGLVKVYLSFVRPAQRHIRITTLLKTAKSMHHYITDLFS
jgi:type II secretory pathway component PulM